MGYQIEVDRKDFGSFREYLSEQEYRLLKRVIPNDTERAGLNKHALSTQQQRGSCKQGEIRRRSPDTCQLMSGP